MACYVHEVRTLQSLQRHCCSTLGCGQAWQHLHYTDYELHKNDVCPRCNTARFERRGGKLYPQKVFWYFGVKEMIADYFKDPEWSVSFKKDKDLSLNSPHCSEAAKALDDYYSGEVLGPHGCLGQLWADGFETHKNGSSGSSTSGWIAMCVCIP
jgi:hypothetical protein